MRAIEKVPAAPGQVTGAEVPVANRGARQAGAVAEAAELGKRLHGYRYGTTEKINQAL
jgi:hypothetical protein